MSSGFSSLIFTLRLCALTSVPAIRLALRRTGTIEMDYIWGRDLRQVLANGRSEIDYEDIGHSFLALLDTGCQNKISEQIAGTVRDVIARGVIPRDVHAANFIQGHRSGRLYMVDFNFVHLRPAPGWRSHVRSLAWLFADRAKEIVSG